MNIICSILNTILSVYLYLQVCCFLNVIKIFTDSFKHFISCLKTYTRRFRVVFYERIWQIFNQAAQQRDEASVSPFRKTGAQTQYLVPLPEHVKSLEQGQQPVNTFVMVTSAPCLRTCTPVVQGAPFTPRGTHWGAGSFSKQVIHTLL